MHTVAPRWIAPLALLALLPGTSAAQGTLADYRNAEKLLGANLSRVISIADVDPNWIGESDRFWYLRTGPGGRHFVLVDAAAGTSGPAFDQARLAAALSDAAGRAYQADSLPFVDFEFADDGTTIRFEADDMRWSCSVDTYRCRKAPARDRAGPYESLSPDGRWAAFVQDHDLYVRNTSTGAVVRLTRDGVAGWDYATPLPDLRTLVAQRVSKGEDVREEAAVDWSPDSKRLVTYRLDSRDAGRFTAEQYVPSDRLRPRSFDFVYPLPGEVLPTAQPVVFDLEPFARVDVKTAPLQVVYYGGPRFQWLSDGRHFSYEYRARGDKAMELRVVDAATGDQRTIVREEAGTYPFVDPYETMFRFLNRDKEVLWTSERSGWNQLYLYDAATGRLENPVTQGDWVVRDIVAVDEKARQVYFLAAGVRPGLDPYYTQLYRVGLDGKGMKLLTPDSVDHTASFSPDRQYFVDNASAPDHPGESVLRRASDGSVVRVLEKTDDSGLTAMGFQPAIPFQGTAADDTTPLWGAIVRPTNFDASKKYPIVEYIYTGPHGFFAPKTFAAAVRLQSMAELGFVVVMVDGRGTSGRSRAFHSFSYHNLGNVFIDHVTMIKEMARKYAWMDSTRVGIYGTSAGGYGSAHAFLQFPDFYKVCVSTSGDHDPRLDKAVWNEVYQGYPLGEDYVDQANQQLAHDLKGHLLLIHGDVDQNVNASETMRLVDALMSANKSFDMLFVPNMNHGDSGPHALYVSRRRWDYFVQHLLGVTPPEDFQIHEAPRMPGRR